MKQITKINYNFFSKRGIKEAVVLIAFAIGVAVFYGNTLQNDFVFDNHQTIEQNIYTRSLEYIPRIITTAPFLYYRPLLSLSDLFTYQISSQPRVFHLVNLVYFAIDVFLVFILAKLLTGNFLIAFFSGLIFLIHPINSEAVNWISTPDLLCAIFILLAAIYYLLYREKQKSKYLIFVYIFYALGILTKEPAVFLPFIFLTLDLTFFKQKISSLLRWSNLKPYVICLVIFSAYMGLRFWVLGGLGGAAGVTHKLNTVQEIYAFFYLFTLYIQKLFWPYPLSFLYNNSPFSYRFLSINFLTAILVATGYAGLCVFAWKRKWFGGFFGLVWFLVFLFPSLAFINSLVVMFAERYLFTPSIGFSILAAIILGWFWKRGKREKIAVVILLSIVSFMSFAIIYQRNMFWKSDINIYQDALKKDPDSDVLRYDLAMAYWDKGDTATAKEILGQFIKSGTGDSLVKAYNNLGDIYRREGKDDEAMRYFEKAIKLDPNHKQAHNNIGALSLQKGDLLRSVSSLCQALLIDPQFTDANTNFNMAASAIQGLDNKSFMSLSDQILKGDIFKPSSSVIPASSSVIPAKAGIHTNKSGDDQEKAQDIIRFKTKDCSLPQGCILIFSTKLKPDQTPFPFLIMGKTENNQIVRARYFEVNPQNNDMALGIDREFSQSKIHFYLPGCGGKYYEAETK